MNLTKAHCLSHMGTTRHVWALTSQHTTTMTSCRAAHRATEVAWYRPGYLLPAELWLRVTQSEFSGSSDTDSSPSSLSESEEESEESNSELLESASSVWGPPPSIHA